MINPMFVFLIVLVFIIILLVLNFDKLFSKKDEEKYVKICPRCGSTKIKIDFSNPAVWAAGTPPKYVCLYCNRISSIFPDVTLENIGSFRNQLEKDRKIAQKNDLIDVSSGYTLGMFDYVYLTLITLLVIAVFFVFHFILNY